MGENNGKTLGTIATKVTADTTRHDKAIDASEQKIKGLGTESKNSLGIAGQAWTRFGRTAAGVLAGVSFGAVIFDMERTAASFERMEIQLNKLSDGRGRSVLDELNQWALTMPVNTQKAVDSFRLLMGLGLNPTMEMMETLTDVASIFGEDVLSRISLQLGQMSAKGKVMAEDLNILAEAGINARKYLKTTFGMTVEELQDSGIAVSKIINAIFDGMQKDFGGSAKDMMKSWDGLKTTALSYFMEIERRIMGAGVFDAMKNGLDGINTGLANWIDNNEELIRQKVPDYIDNLKDSVQRIVDIYNVLPPEITAVAGYGLVGRMLWGGSAGKFIATASIINDGLRRWDLDIGSLGEKWDEYLTSVQNISDVLAGRKDWNTGESIASTRETDALTAQIEKQQKLVDDLKGQYAKQEKWDWVLDMFEPGGAEKMGAWLAREEANLKKLIKQQSIKLPVSLEVIQSDTTKPYSTVDAIAAERERIAAVEAAAENLKKAQKEAAENLKKAQKEMETLRKQLHEEDAGAQIKALKEQQERWVKAGLNRVEAERVTSAAIAKVNKEQMEKTFKEHEALSTKALESIYQQQASYLQQFDGGFGFLTLEIDEETYRVTEDELDNLLKGLDAAQKKAKDTGITFGDLVGELKDIGQSETGIFFTDAIRGELDSFEDYMGSFTRSLQSAWGDMVAQMIFKWQAIGSLSMAGSFGVMGLIGGGLALAGGLFGDGGPSEREIAMKEWERSLESINDRLAELTMSDADYELYKLNQSMTDFAAQSASARQSTEKLVELRKEETKAIIEQSRQRYTDINTSIDSWLTDLARRNWEASDWQLRLDQIGAELSGLNPTASDYEDQSINLLNEQFDVLKQIYGVQSEHLSLFKDSQKSVDEKIWELSNTGGSPVSTQAYQDRYTALKTAAAGGDAGAVSDLLSFITPYMSTMGNMGMDTTSLRQSVIGDLTGVSASLGGLSDQAAQDAVNQAAAEAAAKRAQEEAAAAQRQAAYNTWAASTPTVSITLGGKTITQQDFANMALETRAYRQGNTLSWWSEGVANQAAYHYIPQLLAWIQSGINTGNVDPQKGASWSGWLGGYPNTNIGGSAAEKVLLATQMMSWLNSKPSDFPGKVFGHAYGGLARGGGRDLNIIAEAGYDEWAVPAHNSPYNANFLRSVGAEPAKIAAEVAKLIGGNNGGPITIQLIMDGRMTAEVVVGQIRKNGQIKRALVKELS